MQAACDALTGQNKREIIMVWGRHLKVVEIFFSILFQIKQ
jgi:hypothetical protein